MHSRQPNPIWVLLTIACLCGFAYAQNVQEPMGNSQSNNDTLLWGPYRPNLYFGIRPRLPNSILTGLLWANADEYQGMQNNFRHTCEQGDNMAGYGWEEYDAQLGGREVIHDVANSLDLTVDYVKIPGGKHGGSWGARVSGKIRDTAPDMAVTTVVFYTSLEGLGQLQLENEVSESRYEGPIKFKGSTADLGDFDIEVTEGRDNKLPFKVHQSWDDKPLDGTLVATYSLPPEHIWRTKDVMFSSMKGTIDGYVEKYGQEKMPPPWQAFTIEQAPKAQGNVHLVQKVLVGAFEFDILFNSGSASERVTSETLDERIPAVSKSFKKKFDATFKAQKPFDDHEHKACAESLFSNLLGGIGYFYGDSVVDRSYAPEYDEVDEGFWEEAEAARSKKLITHDEPKELFTSVPSRPFFPRGFLWDEGFHLIPIVEWDADLALEVLKSWFKLIDEEGWIAREQILGAEARSKVPEEFQTQYPHYANPPTLFLIVDVLVEKIKTGKLVPSQADHLKAELSNLYPLLVRQYEWFRRTQTGDIKSYDREAFSKKEAYRWRGRTPRHILTSGLDDYPRAQPPHPGELHLDLISWMGLVSRSLTNLADLLSEADDSKKFNKQHEAILRNIDDLHWSASQKVYCDATIDDYEEHAHECHKGYISLFPLMTQLLPSNHPNIPAILDIISSPDDLWSNYGIRSLSKASEFYGSDENYWRSPIWVNMNYLILKALLTLSTDTASPAPVKTRATQLYTDLRKNLVNNVVQQWTETGFAWEQYNPETGKGQRTQHFTGWTSLVVSIMGMPDLSDGAIKHSEL